MLGQIEDCAAQRGHLRQHLAFVATAAGRKQPHDRCLRVDHALGTVAEFQEVEGFTVGQRHLLHLQADLAGQPVAGARPQKVEAVKRQVFAQRAGRRHVSLEQRSAEVGQGAHGRA